MNDLMVKYGNGDQQEMSESDTSKIDSQDAKTSSETDTESEDSEKHNESSSSDDTEQESPIIIGSEEDVKKEEEKDKNIVYLVYVDGDIKGYHDTKEAAQNYIEKLAKDYKKSYDALFPGWTIWLEKFYNKVRIITRYNLFIMNYDRVEHVFKYQNVEKLGERIRMRS